MAQKHTDHSMKHGEAAQDQDNGSAQAMAQLASTQTNRSAADSGEQEATPGGGQEDAPKSVVFIDQRLEGADEIAAQIDTSQYDLV